MTEEDLIENFQNYEVPENLMALFMFVNQVSGQEYFSDGFEFSADKEKLGLKTYSTDELFLNSIHEFANADGTGSTYAFWLKDNITNLENAPIVVFGSEGGYHVVAKNLDELLQILTFDCEPMVGWDEVYYYKNTDEYEPSRKITEYRKWLKKELSIDSLDNADPIVQSAQNEYQASFKAWVGNFYDD